MYDLNELTIGDKFYKVSETNLAFNRKKIHTMIDGVQWFRYENPLREYYISTYEIVGIVRHSIEGIVPKSVWMPNDHLDLNVNINGKTFTNMDLQADQVFLTCEEALSERCYEHVLDITAYFVDYSEAEKFKTECENIISKYEGEY